MTTSKQTLLVAPVREMDPEAIFGETGSLFHTHAQELTDNYWTGEKNHELLKHVYRVEPNSFHTGGNEGHPDLRVTTFLVNADAHRVRRFTMLDQGQLHSREFSELLAEALEVHSTRKIRQLVDSDTLIDNIVNEFIPRNGLRLIGKTYTSLYVTNKVIEHCSREGYSSALGTLAAYIWVSVMSANHLIDSYDELRQMRYVDTLGISEQMFRTQYIAYFLAKKLSKLDLEQPGMRREDAGVAIVQRRVFAAWMKEVFSRIAMAFRDAALQRQRYDNALAQIGLVATGDLELVPVSIQNECLQLGSYWNLLAFSIDASRNKTRATLTASELELERSIQDMIEFLMKSQQIEGWRATDIANYVTVEPIIDDETGWIESIVMTTERDRAKGREAFYSPSSVGDYRKTYAEPDLSSRIEGLLASDSTVFQTAKLDRLLYTALNQAPVSTSLVYDFTAAHDIDRDIFAAAVALTRSDKVRLSRDTEGNYELVYSVKPSHRLVTSKNALSLQDMVSTADPRLIIAVTGGVTGKSLLPGYNCQLQLDTRSRNLVQIRNADFITPFDEPLYVYTLTYKDEKNAEQSVRLEHTPLKLLSLDDLFEGAQGTHSMTNREQDMLEIRKIVLAWLSIETAMKKADESDIPALDSLRTQLATVVLDNMIDVVINNPATLAGLDLVVRQVAAKHGIRRTHRKLYRDEHIVSHIALYVAGIALAHMQGVPVRELTALNHMIDTSDAIAWSVISDRISKLMGRAQ